MLTDFRTAIRAMRRQPGFGLSAILTLALGLGGTTALFGLIHNQCLRPLPYATEARLVDISLARPGEAELTGVAPFDLTQWRSGQRLCEQLAICRPVGREVQLGEGGIFVPAAEVSSGFFEALGYGPVLGRFFTADEDRPGTPSRVVVGYRFWRERLGGDPGVLGRPLVIRGQAHQIVGVAPDHLVFPNTWLTRPPEFFALARGYGDRAEDREFRSFRALGLLRRGVGRGEAQLAFQGIQAGLGRAYPESHGHLDIRVRDLRSAVLGRRQGHLPLLLGASGLLLLLACLNVGGLFVARSLTRVREAAVRAALGATWGRLVPPFLAEGLLVSVGGAVGGLVLASLLLRMLPRLLEEAGGLPGASQPTLGLIPVLLGCFLTLGACLVCSLAPVLMLGMENLTTPIKEGGAGASASQGRLRGLLLAGEVALSVMLLVGSCLLLRSFEHVAFRRLGFQTRNVVLFDVSTPPLGRSAPQLTFHRGLVERLSALPGVQSVGTADQGTVFRSQDGTRFRLGNDAPDPTNPFVPTLCASPGYFATVGVPLRQGRDIAWTDGPEAPGVVLVNETFVRRFLPGRDPIGQRLRLSGIGEAFQVVGVVADARFGGPEAEVDPLIVQSMGQYIHGGFIVYLRTARALTDLQPDVLAALRASDPAPHPVELARLDDLLSESLIQRRNTLCLLGGFTLMALGLASMGIYGMAAYAVAQRRREIAIRMALGGDGPQVVSTVLRQDFCHVLLGLAVGIAASLAGGTLLRSQLVEITAQDPVAFTLSVLVLGLVALAAWGVLAMRAARIHPARALRSE